MESRAAVITGSSGSNRGWQAVSTAAHMNNETTRSMYPPDLTVTTMKLRERFRSKQSVDYGRTGLFQQLEHDGRQKPGQWYREIAEC